MTDVRSGLLGEGPWYCIQCLQGRLQEAPLGHRGGWARSVGGSRQSRPTLRQLGAYLDRELLQYIECVDWTLDFL